MYISEQTIDPVSLLMKRHASKFFYADDITTSRIRPAIEIQINKYVFARIIQSENCGEYCWINLEFDIENKIAVNERSRFSNQDMIVLLSPVSRKLYINHLAKNHKVAIDTLIGAFDTIMFVTPEIVSGHFVSCFDHCKGLVITSEPSLEGLLMGLV